MHCENTKTQRHRGEEPQPNERICVLENSPPWLRRGGRDSNKNAAKPLVERTGWFVQRQIIGGLNEPPRLRELRRLRENLLIAQPPLLNQGGESLVSTLSATAPATRWSLISSKHRL
jgi:hypothetical protein